MGREQAERGESKQLNVLQARQTLVAVVKTYIALCADPAIKIVLHVLHCVREKKKTVRRRLSDQ